jgi:hypothetical protein
MQNSLQILVYWTLHTFKLYNIVRTCHFSAQSIRYCALKFHGTVEYIVCYIQIFFKTLKHSFCIFLKRATCGWGSKEFPKESHILWMWQFMLPIVSTCCVLICQLQFVARRCTVPVGIICTDAYVSRLLPLRYHNSR